MWPTVRFAALHLNGSYAIINVIAVPEHNPTGEPGGPFNSFDISSIAPDPGVSRTLLGLHFRPHRLGRRRDRYQHDIAVNAIQGSNAVAGAGNGASPCDPSIPPLSSTVFGNFTSVSVEECALSSRSRVSGRTVISEDFRAHSAARRGLTA